MKKLNNDENSSLKIDESKIKQIKNKIREYNTYENFLISVHALKKDGSKVSCIAFPKSDMDNYYKKIVMSLHTGFADTFFFEKITVNYYTDEKGNKNYNDYFTPKSFFDYIKRYSLN